jgi:hypothetical protein
VRQEKREVRERRELRSSGLYSTTGRVEQQRLAGYINSLLWVEASFSHPATGLALLENKGIEHLVSAMQRRPLNRLLQDYACSTISHIVTAHRKIAVGLLQSQFFLQSGN